MAIVDEIDGMALRLGRLLREAKAIAGDEFNGWVERDLPFGLETARRLIGISAAYEKLPPEKVALLPRPWQAMYALKELPVAILDRGMASGEISPSMTTASAKSFAKRARGGLPNARRLSRVDMAAGMLMQFAAREMSPGVRDALDRWLERAVTPET